MFSLLGVINVVPSVSFSGFSTIINNEIYNWKTDNSVLLSIVKGRQKVGRKNLPILYIMIKNDRSFKGSANDCILTAKEIK